MKLKFGKKAGADSQAAQTSAAPQNKKRKAWVKRVIALVLVAAIAGGAARYFLGRGGAPTAEAQSAYTEAQVERRDITATITGSGTLEAANTYSVTSLVEGTILSSSFEEGDQVEQDMVLYTIDSSDAESSLQQAQLSVEQAQRSYNSAVANRENLYVRAPISGQVIELAVEIGDEVSAGQTIATVRDSGTMELTLRFPSDDVDGFYVGQTATVTLDGTFETVSGTVSKISQVEEVLSGNRIVRPVTIQVQNPGGINTSQAATAEVNGVGSSDSATFAYRGEETVVAADHISFQIQRGEFVAIVGKSGSGKSTCMNIIGCLDVPSEGTYLLDGRDVGQMNKNELAEIRNELLGFIFQQYNLLPKLNLLENVEVPLMYAGASRGDRRERARLALEMVGLGDKLRNKPSQLSGGQQQRASIARALAGEPAVILADEPTGALDSRTGREVLELLQSLHAAGHTVVLITHDNSIAVQAQRIIRLEDGRVVYDGPADAPEAVVTPKASGEEGGGAAWASGNPWPWR